MHQDNRSMLGSFFYLKVLSKFRYMWYYRNELSAIFLWENRGNMTLMLTTKEKRIYICSLGKVKELVLLMIKALGKAEVINLHFEEQVAKAICSTPINKHGSLHACQAHMAPGQVQLPISEQSSRCHSADAELPHAVQEALSSTGRAATALRFVWRGLSNELMTNKRTWENAAHNFLRKPGANWSCPGTGKLKVNVDAAVGSECLCAASITRDQQGQVRFVAAKHTTSIDPELVEAMAVLMGIKVALAEGVEKRFGLILLGKLQTLLWIMYSLDPGLVREDMEMWELQLWCTVRGTLKKK